jgi:hypothetical protein
MRATAGAGPPRRTLPLASTRRSTFAAFTRPIQSWRVTWATAIPPMVGSAWHSRSASTFARRVGLSE